MQRTISSTKGKVSDSLVCQDPKIRLTEEQVKRRLNLFDQFFQKQNEKIQSQEKKEINITLPDGKVIKGTSLVTTPIEIAKGISPKLADSSIVARISYTQKYSNVLGPIIDVDSEENDSTSKKSTLISLNTPLEGDCSLELLDFNTPEGKQTFWHSSAHLLGRALEIVYGGFLTHGPPLSEGFFYDCYMGDQKVLIEDYQKIEEQIQKLISAKQPFQQVILTKQEALELLADNPFKVHLINSKIADDQLTSAYKVGDFVDLCTGPHVNNSQKIKSFKVESNSASYWLGNQNLDSLQRVYAISFPSKEQLKEYIKIKEELKKRDHRIIGEQQKLFMINDMAPGCIFFLQHGTRIFNRLQELMRKQYYLRGYTEVNTPTMFKNELWKTSGHFFKYAKDMFFVNTDEGEQFGIKPMNCPSHCLVFGSSLRSFWDLPLRIADFGVLHRNELSGALSGLTRVRKFHQDDAHIFCRPDQIEQEVLSTLEFIDYVYSLFGFQYSFELSTRPQQHIGSIEFWDNAEDQLKKVLEKTGRKWKLNPGDGAFYGPKIDIKVKDCFGRLHQLGTVQLDFNLPQRFNLQYKSSTNTEEEEHNQAHKEGCCQEAQNKEELTEEELYAQPKKLKTGFERPIIIHRAILGSIERCMAILIEHFGGKWPFWLSPRQISICTVSQEHEDYAQQVKNRLEQQGFYVEIDDSNSSLAKKIRNSQLSQFNYILVIGKEEVANQTVNVRKRDMEVPLGSMNFEEFQKILSFELESIVSEVEKKHLLKGVFKKEENFKLNEKGEISYESLKEYERVLQQNMYLEQDSLSPGEKDSEVYELLKELSFKGTNFQALDWWTRAMELQSKQKKQQNLYYK